MKRLKKLWVSSLSALLACSIVLSSVEANALALNETQVETVSGNDEVSDHGDHVDYDIPDDTDADNDADTETFIGDDISSSDLAETESYDEGQSVPVEYTITYKLDGGINAEENPDTYTSESEDIVLLAPSKTGYTFAGWYTNSKLTKPVTVITSGSTGNKVFYAKWSVNKYNVTFDGNGATSGSMKTLKNKSYNTKFALTANAFSKKGYTFTGWNTAVDGSGTAYANKAKVSKLSEEKGATVTLYAQWTITEYKITYKLNGGTNAEENPATYTINDETITLDSPVREGAEFMGWYKDSALKRVSATIDSGSTGNKTFYAKWKVYKYNINFDGNGATSGAMKMLKNKNCGTKYALTGNAYTRKGYSFAGWNTQADGQGVSYANKAKVVNLSVEDGTTVTLYAQWKLIEYKITYKLNGGTNNEENPDTYTVEDSITLHIPTKDNNMFVGWYTDSKYKKAATEIKAGSTGAKSFYAKWTVCKHEGAEKTTIEEATCTTPEIYRITCAYCGKVIEEEGTINPEAHTYDEGVVTKERTKTEDGELTYICQRCGNIYTEIIPKLEDVCTHEETEKTLIAEATCSSPKVYRIVCICCDKVIDECFEEEGSENPDAHTYGEGVVTKESTETEEGELIYTCIRCDHSYTEVIPKKECNHEYVYQLVTEKATREHSGKKLFICGKCEFEKEEEFTEQAHSHHYVLDENYINEMEKKGEKIDIDRAVSCIKCGRISVYVGSTTVFGGETAYVYKNLCKDWAPVIFSIGTPDDYIFVNYDIDVCELAGVHSQSVYKEIGDGRYKLYCDLCDAEVGEIDINKRSVCAHSTVREEIRKFPTERSRGITEIFCADCGLFLGEGVAPVLDHIHSYAYIKRESTCSRVGFLFGICDCGLTYYERIPKSPHEYDEMVVVTEPTCETNGLESTACMVCSAVYSKEIPKLGHDYELIDTKKASCIADGYYLYKCKNCEGEMRQTIYKNNTHIYPEEYEVVEESTCNSYGKGVYKCTLCGKDLQTVRLPLLAHTYEWVVVKEPTYSEDGERDEICIVCGKVRAREVILCEEKKNCQHTGAWGITTKKIADCQSPKIYNKVCATCQAVIDDNYVTSDELNPTNHTKIVKNVVREKTATEAGLVTYTCVDCGKVFEFNTTKTYDECVHYEGRTRITENDKACEYCNTCGEVARELGLACTHNVTKRQVVRQEATETQNGIIDLYCPGCQDFIKTVEVHAYKTYYVDIGNGETATVIGWVEDEYNDTVIDGENSYLDENGWSYEVLKLENKYRSENDLNELEWNCYLQEAANLRAVEAAYDFSHTRPNGQPWYTANRTFMSGENLGIGHKDPETIMNGWKNSAGHNKNLLYPTFRSVAIGVFHMYTFTEGNAIPQERIVWSMNFSYIG